MSDRKIKWTQLTYPMNQYYKLVDGELVYIDRDSEEGKAAVAHSHEILQRQFDKFVEKPNA